MSIILFLIILAVLIISHEFGHFIVAKKLGIRVDEFAIGFPPKLFSWVRGETRYSLNLLPFGGYVKIFGEDPSEEAINGRDKERSFTGKPRWAQGMVILAGVFFNLLLAWMLFTVGFIAGVPSGEDNVPGGGIIRDVALTVTGVLPDSPAARAGLSTGDRIVAMGTDTEKPEILDPSSAQQFIASHGELKLAIIYERKKEERSAIVTPITGIVEGKFAIGITMDMVGTAKLPWYRAIYEGALTTYDITLRTVAGLYGLLKQAILGQGSLTALTGPVGIVGLVGDASLFGFAYLISFVALISVNLAVLNLLPFPALDGGRFLFILIESVTRKPIPPKIANTLNAIGFGLLILLMLVVTYHDIAKIIAK